MMDAALYMKKLDRVLDRMGALYALGDVLERLEDGRMQSFAEGNSWVVTQINAYPRARVLDILAAVGDLDECRILHDRVLHFADEHNIPVLRAFGRRGWIPDAAARGWRLKTVNQVYTKEL